MDNEIKNKNLNYSRKILYLVIMISIFILVAIGGTYAFFSRVARSGDDDVTTKSATISLGLISYGSAWSNNDIIPTTRVVSEYAVELQNDMTLGNNILNGEGQEGKKDKNNNTLCKDDNGNSVCSIYEFQVKNTENTDQIIDISIESEANGFDNLNAMTYEISIADNDAYNNVSSKEIPGNNGYGDPIFKSSKTDTTEGAISVKDENNNEVYTETPIFVNRNGVRKTLLKYEETPEDEEENLVNSLNIKISNNNEEEEEISKEIALANNISLSANETKSFIIVLYILENEDNQTPTDANRNFVGKVIVKSSNGSIITGAISN